METKWIEKICEDTVSEDPQEEGGARVGVCARDGGASHLERSLERKPEAAAPFMGAPASTPAIASFLTADVQEY